MTFATKKATASSVGADPTDVGARVLAGFEKGRRLVNAARQRRAAAVRDIVRLYAEQDEAQGNPPQLRPARIYARMWRDGHRLGKSTVYRHFLALYSARTKA